MQKDYITLVPQQDTAAPATTMMKAAPAAPAAPAPAPAPPALIFISIEVGLSL